MNQIISCAVRMDSAGDGRYMARREGGNRKHDGIDFLCMPSAPVVSDVDGKISKLGYAYASDLEWTYVEITDREGCRHRYFYVTHGLVVGDEVKRFQPIGLAQNIAERYPGTNMKPHVHYEVFDPAGENMDPEDILARLDLG